MRSILIITDASTSIGYGHMVRSSYLSEYISSYVRTTHLNFWNEDSSIAITSKLSECKVIDSESDAVSIINNSSEFNLAIIDTYNFYQNVHAALLNKNIKIVYFGKPKSMAQENIYVINVAEGNNPLCSSGANNSYEGIEYFIPNPLLNKIRSERKSSDKIENLLVVFGGTDASFMSKNVYDYFTINQYPININIISERLKKKCGKPSI